MSDFPLDIAVITTTAYGPSTTGVEHTCHGCHTPHPTSCHTSLPPTCPTPHPAPSPSHPGNQGMPSVQRRSHGPPSHHSVAHGTTGNKPGIKTWAHFPPFSGSCMAQRGTNQVSKTWAPLASFSGSWHNGEQIRYLRHGLTSYHSAAHGTTGNK